MSIQEIIATILVENPKNGERAALHARFNWENNFGQGGFWRPWFIKSAEQVWSWCKCTGTGETDEEGFERVSLKILSVTVPEGFHWRWTAWEQTIDLIRHPEKTAAYQNYPTDGALCTERDLERDEDGLLPEEAGYGDCWEDEVA